MWFINVSFCKHDAKFLFVNFSTKMFLSFKIIQSRHAEATDDSNCCFHVCRRILNLTCEFMCPVKRAADQEPSTVTLEADIPNGA